LIEKGTSTVLLRRNDGSAWLECSRQMIRSELWMFKCGASFSPRGHRIPANPVSNSRSMAGC
jgi:hypothetical protein